jgi:hypothetical protein
MIHLKNQTSQCAKKKNPIGCDTNQTQSNEEIIQKVREKGKKKPV